MQAAKITYVSSLGAEKRWTLERDSRKSNFPIQTVADFQNPDDQLVVYVSSRIFHFHKGLSSQHRLPQQVPRAAVPEGADLSETTGADLIEEEVASISSWSCDSAVCPCAAAEVKCLPRGQQLTQNEHLVFGQSRRGALR